MPSSLNSSKKVDKLNIDKVKLVSTDLKKLSDVVGKEVVKKYVFDQLVKKLMLLIPVNLLTK